MAKCCRFFSECRSHAFIKLKYCGMALCKHHYAKNIEDRVEKAVSHYKMLVGTFTRPEKWLILTDGTAEAQTLLAILLKRFKEDPRVKFVPVYIDYGFPSSSANLKAAADLCATHKVDLKQVSFAELSGHTLADVTAKKTPRDAYLAFDALRSAVLAKVAREAGPAKIAVPTCLEDESASLFRSFFNMDVERLSHQYSWETKERATAAAPVRVPPMLEISTEEARMYAFACEIPYEEKTPFSDAIPGIPMDAVKKHLLQIELDRVGNMLNMVRRYHKVFLPAIEAHKAEAPADSRIEDVEERILPLNDLDDVEQQVVPCKRCKIMGEDEMCRGCKTLDALGEAVEEEKTGKVDEGVKEKEEEKADEEMKEVEKKMPVCEFFLTASLNNPGAKRKWKKKNPQQQDKQ